MTQNLARLIFEYGFDARDQFETPQRGYRSHVVAELNDGSRYRLNFFDPVRLKQELDEERAAGRPYFAEPGLIVLPEVTREAMEAAAAALCDQGFFASLAPVNSTE